MQENHTDKKFLLIENKGEIDVNALTLMGGSTKRDSTTSIGYFGSGNKYSIALLIKAGIEFHIFSGNNEFVITTEDVTFRDKTFKKIFVNGKETSLTTEMGPQWDIWMAVREFVSNAVDEGENNIVPSTQTISGREGYTRIYIEHHKEIKNVVTNWNEYFAFDRIDAIVDQDNCRIFPNISKDMKDKRIFYRKGIRCYDQGTAMYHYDLPDFTINESRVIDNLYDAKRKLSRFLVSYATKEIAENIMRNAFGDTFYIESGLEYYGDCWGYPMSTGWRDAIGKKAIVNVDVAGFYMDIVKNEPHYRVSKQLAKKIHQSFPDVKVYGVGDDDEIFTLPVKTTPKMDYQLKKVMEALKEMKYDVTAPIEVVSFSKQSVLGQAKDGIIYISDKQFDKGIREIALTIIEENEHLATGHNDLTREFQNHLFNKWISSLEEQHGIFL
jgi:hypothetical protein